MFAGYIWAWLYDRPLHFPVERIAAAGAAYRGAGYIWLAEELQRMEEMEARRSREQSKLQPVPKSTNEKLPIGVGSLVLRDKPKSDWREPLNAMRIVLGEVVESLPKKTAPNIEASQRLVWEISVSSPSPGNFRLQPFVQRRNKNGWTDGQRVAMKRLHRDEQDGSIEPSCDGDRILMAAVECSVTRNHYGYTDTDYVLDESRAAKGIVGHPAIYMPGNRTTPVEVVHGSPQLTITKTAKEIVGKVSPKPCDGVVAVVESPQRVILISFTPRQIQIGEIIDKQKLFPLESEPELGPTIRSLASHFTIHSEINASEETVSRKTAANKSKASSTAANSKLVVQIKPFGGG